MAVGKDVDLGVGLEFFNGFLLVLVALDVEYVDRHWEVGNHGANGLQDVVVRVEKVEGGGEVVNRAM
jgi:hypothetical protein